MIEFILARYNYWIVIILMMTGLYIVFSRGNLVKTIVGLNLFQTSVFIFYITIGKVAGGTAPILVGGSETEHGHHDDDHGHDHGDVHDTHQSPHQGPHESIDHDTNHGEALSHEDATAFVQGSKANALDLNSNVPGTATDHSPLPEGSLHSMPELGPPVGSETGIAGGASNDLLAPTPYSPPHSTSRGGGGEALDRSDVTLVGPETPAEVSHDLSHGADAIVEATVGATTEILYSNPLPHVLILTAIVVGVATTAVGLAIAVRIREAYGTIEEDDLERMDNISEFGSVSADTNEGKLT